MEKVNNYGSKKYMRVNKKRTLWEKESPFPIILEFNQFHNPEFIVIPSIDEHANIGNYEIDLVT